MIKEATIERVIERLEAGEDPAQIEREMGDVFEGDDALPFEFKQAGKSAGQKIPSRDETLYEM